MLFRGGMKCWCASVRKCGLRTLWGREIDTCISREHAAHIAHEQNSLLQASTAYNLTQHGLLSPYTLPSLLFPWPLLKQGRSLLRQNKLIVPAAGACLSHGAEISPPCVFRSSLDFFDQTPCSVHHVPASTDSQGESYVGRGGCSGKRRAAEDPEARRRCGQQDRCGRGMIRKSLCIRPNPGCCSLMMCPLSRAVCLCSTNAGGSCVCPVAFLQVFVCVHLSVFTLFMVRDAAFGSLCSRFVFCFKLADRVFEKPAHDEKAPGIQISDIGELSFCVQNTCRRM